MSDRLVLFISNYLFEFETIWAHLLLTISSLIRFLVAFLVKTSLRIEIVVMLSVLKLA